MQCTWDCLQQFSFWLPLFINTCLLCLINCQLASWLILRIVFLPNLIYETEYCMIVCTEDHMANIVDVRIPSQGLSLSKSNCWILNVCILLQIIWCNLSTIAFACGFLTLMGLHLILQSFAIIDLTSAEKSSPLYTVIWLGRGYLVNQTSSSWSATRSALTLYTESISIQPVAGFIMVIAYK